MKETELNTDGVKLFAIKPLLLLLFTWSPKTESNYDSYESAVALHSSSEFNLERSQSVFQQIPYPNSLLLRIKRQEETERTRSDCSKLL